MQPELIHYLAVLLDQEVEEVTELNAKVPYVRYSVGWIVKLFDDINRVVLTLPLTVYEGT